MKIGSSAEKLRYQIYDISIILFSGLFSNGRAEQHAQLLYVKDLICLVPSSCRYGNIQGQDRDLGKHINMDWEEIYGCQILCAHFPLLKKLLMMVNTLLRRSVINYNISKETASNGPDLNTFTCKRISLSSDGLPVLRATTLKNNHQQC